MGSIKRVFCAAVVVVSSSAFFAAPAQAGLLGSLGTVVKSTTTTVSNTTTGVVGQVLPPDVTQAVNVIPADYDPLTPLEQLLGGQVGLGTVLQQALCKPVTEVAELAAQLGLNPIGDGLTTLACSASILEYRFYTRFRRADGSNLERTHQATLGVPMLLNVDADSDADLIGTITLTSANTVGLTIDRLPTETATLPVSVEAVLRDPGTGLLGREHIAFGYDARADRAPGRFVLATPIDTILRPSPDFRLTVSQTNRGEKVALIGGLFDGTLATRVNPAEVRIDYTKSPDTATLRAQVGESVAATLTTNRPGPATVSGRIVDVGDEDRFNVSLEDLPSSLSLTADTSGALNVTYNASARVARIRGSLERLNNLGPVPTLLQKAVIALDDVPRGLQVTQAGEGGSLTTTGGPIGRTKVGVANGEPKFLTGEPAYVNLDDDGTLQSLALELSGLERATFTVGNAVAVSAKLTATPLYARIVEPGRSIDARVDQLPSEFDLGFDPEGGTLEYDGRGTGIDRITLAVDSDTPLFSRATKLRGTIEDIPALLNATLQTGDGSGGIVVDGSGPIGSIELVASNGPETLPAGSGQGAIFRDLTGGEFLISARILGLRALTFVTSPATSLTAHTAGGPFSLDVQTDDLDIDGNVQDLPAKATFGLDQDNGKLTFSGRNEDDSPQGIDLLTLTASSPNALFGRADRLDARIEDLPADLELTLAPGSDQVAIEASNPIGLIELIAANRAIDSNTDLPAGTDQGVHYVDTTADFVVGARIRGLKRIAAQLNGPIALETETAGGLFLVDITTNDLTGTARIEDLPSHLNASLDLDAGRLALDGHGQDIGRILLDIAGTTPLFGRATDIEANIVGIPSNLVVDIAQAGNGASVVANEPIGLIELVAANHAPQADDLPVNNEQGAKFTDLTNGEFTIGARVRQLKRLSATFGSPVSVSTETEGGPFGVRFTTDDLSGLARVEDLPSQFDASLDLEAGRLTVDGHGQEIGRVTLNAQSTSPVFGRATDVNANIEGIPSLLTLDIAQSGDGASVVANEPIDLIEVFAGNHAQQPDDLPLNSEQGVKLVDLTGGEFTLGARVRKLERLSASFADAISLSTKTEGGPFGVRVTTDDLRASARIEDLPAELDVTADLAAGQLTVDGHGQAIERISVDVDGDTPLFGRATDVHALVEGIPALLTLDLAQSGTGVRLEANEAIGLIELVAADHDIADPTALLPASGEQGAIFRDMTATFELGARVRELKKVVADLAGTVGLQALTAGGPFSVLAQTNDLTANARFADLPADVDATFDPTGGAFTYHGKKANGDPVGVDLVTLDVEGSSPLFDRATRVSARIEQLAPDVVFTIDPAGPSADVTSSAPIGKLEFLATDIPSGDPVPDIPAGEQGAIYHDKTGEPFILRARLLDLQNIAFGLSADNIEVTSKLRSTPFGVDLMTDDLDAEARIADLPARTELGIDLTQGTFSYKGFDSSDNPVGVNSITFTAESDTPLFGRARLLKGELLGVPAEISVGFQTTAGGASVSIPNGNLGSLALLVSDGQNTALPTTQSVLYHDNTNEFRIAAKVVGLKQLTASFTDALALVIKRTAGSRFTADIDVADALSATADIQDLPASAEFGLDLEGTSTTNPNALTFKGRDENDQPVGIAVLDLAASAAEPIFGAGRFIQGHIEQLPSDVEIGFSQVNGKASVKSTAPGNPNVQGPPVGRIELAASDTEGQFEYPAGGAQGAVMKTKTGEPFRIGVRILSLERLEVDFLEAIDLSTKTAGGLFLADVETDGFEAEATIDQLPTQLDLGLDLDGGQVTYAGSSPINRISAAIHSATPVFLGATDFTADLLSVPTQFTLGLPQDGELSSLSLTTTGAPIGQIDVTAHSPNRAAPTLAAGVAGAKFDSTNDELGLALRVFQLQSLTVSLEPLTLHAKMAGGHKFVVDAKLPNETTGTTAAQAEIDQLPSDVTLSLADIPGSTEANPLGSRLSLVGNARINLVKLATQGIELLEGADKIDAQIEDLPEKLQLDLPEPGTGPLAQITGRNAANVVTDIGQIRLAAGSGTVVAPADTYNLATRIASGDDQLQFTQAGAFSAGVRLSAVKTLTLNLNPINLALTQDAARTRPIAINATLPNTSGPNAIVTALLNKPAASTSMTVTQGAGQPTRLIFDNSANMTRLDLNAQNLGSAPLVDAHLDNLSRKMSICLDSGGLCRRANPNALSGGNGGGMNRPYAAQTSIDLDDENTQLAGQQTTLNADIKTSPTAETIEIDNLRFRNISFDLGQGGTFSGPAGQTFPRLYLFIDSRNQDFVINRIRYPPTVQEFRIGTDGNQGRASNRIVWLKGGNFFSLDTASAGSHHCGDRKVLSVSTPLGNINVLNFLGFQLIPVCSSGG